MSAPQRNIAQQRGRALRVERVYPHARAKLWRALTEAELLGQWLMPNDFEARVGHRFTFRTDPGPGFDGIVHCEVLELEPERSMTWSWRGGPLDTQVRFELEEIDAQSTRLRVVHTGFRGVKAALVRMIFKIGNRTIYGKKLPAVLDALDRGDASAVPRLEDAACMSGWQKILAAAARVLPGSHKKAGPATTSDE